MNFESHPQWRLSKEKTIAVLANLHWAFIHFCCKIYNISNLKIYETKNLIPMIYQINDKFWTNS